MGKVYAKDAVMRYTSTKKTTVVGDITIIETYSIKTTNTNISETCLAKKTYTNKALHKKVTLLFNTSDIPTVTLSETTNDAKHNTNIISVKAKRKPLRAEKNEEHFETMINRQWNRTYYNIDPMRGHVIALQWCSGMINRQNLKNVQWGKNVEMDDQF